MIDYYILIAGCVAIGTGMYMTGYFLLLNEHTTPINRQRSLGFNGSCCYLVSVIISPISGFVTSSFEGMTGYIIIFVITIISFLAGAYFITSVPYKAEENYTINFSKVGKYIFSHKGTVFTYMSESMRGMRSGMTFYYAPILLYSMTSNEFVLGISLMLKHLSSIGSCNYMKNIKTPHKRLLSTVVPLGVELITLALLIITVDSPIMVVLAFIYGSLFVLPDILGTNLSQIPLFESMILLRRNCGSDREFMAVRQLTFSLGKTLGVVILIFLPTDPVTQLLAVSVGSLLAFSGAFLCNAGAKLISKEVENG